jgi:hypothetical protein
MSIKAKPWEGGGAASVPDASETVKGIIRIATSAEATTGTDDTIAMTPLTVKERIDAAVTGGVQYKGTFDANTGTPSLANAEKGDLYVIGTAGSIYGQVWTEGDHLLINEDMGGTITNSKIDKVDNTDRVSSVNSMTGAVVISGNDVVADHTASNYTAANPQVDGHFSGVDTALGTKLSDITGESLDDLSDVSYTAGAGIDNYVLTYDHSTTSWGAEAVPSAPVTSVNSLTGAVTISGDDVAADHTATNYTAANANVDGHLSGIDTALGNKQPLDAGLTSISGLTTSADKMIYTTASDTYAVADLTSAGRALLDDADAAAQRTTLGLGTAATSASTDFLASTAGLDDLSDVSYTAGAGIDNYVLTYDHSTTSWGAEVVPSAPVTSVNSLTGAVTISGDDVAADHSATNYTAANANVDGHLSGIDTALGNKQPLDSGLTSISGLTTSADKMIYTTASDTYAVTDLTSAGRALLDDADASAQRTTLGLGTAATSASTDFLASTAGLNDLSDVTISSVSNGQVISYNSTSGEWENSTPASSGGQPNLTVVSSTSYTLSAANAPNIYIWYGASNSSTFTVTMPAIADVISDIASVGGSPAETFEVHIGRGQGGDITVSATNGIDLLGDGSVTYSTTQTINAGEWIKLIGWKVSASTARYLMNSPISQLTNLSDVTITSATSGNLLQHNGTAFVNVAKSTIDVGTFNDDGTYQPLDAGLTSISGLTTAADKMIYTTASDTYAVADLTSAGRALLDDADASAQRTTLGLGTAATSASTDFLASTAGLNDLSDVSFTAGAGIDNYVLTYDHSTTSWGAEAAAGGGSSWTYSAITADPANAQAGYHYSCTGTFTITLPTSGVSSGEEIRVKNMGTGTITIDPQTQNIDGSTTDYVMDVQYSAITLVSTGSHWEVI